MTAFGVPANLAFDTYGELTAAIADWMNRSDLSGSVNGMIALAESRIRRRLDPLFNEATITLTTAADGGGTLPSNHGTINRVIYDTATLPRWSGYSVSDIGPGTVPLAYTLDANQIRLWPACAVDVTLFYQPDFPSLSPEAPSNELLSNHPDLYFFGAMLFAEGYVANDARAALFKDLFDEALNDTEAYMTRQKYSGPLAPRIVRC